MSTSQYYDSILKGEWTKNANGQYIHPITKQPVTQAQYYEQAFTPDANTYRADQKITTAVQEFFAQPKSPQESYQYMLANNMTPEQLASRAGKSVEQIFPYITDDSGNQYRSDQLLKVAAQVGENFNKDNKATSFNTTGLTIGFSYNDIKSLFPPDVPITGVEQTVFDMARGALSLGITDLNALKNPNVAGLGGPRGGYEYYFPPGTPGLENVPTTNNTSYPGWHVLKGDRDKGVAIGGTYAGKGGETQYYFDPAQGQVLTRVVDTGNAQDIGLVLAFATFGIGGPAAIGSFITGGAATGFTAAAIGSAAINFATNIAMGANPLDALKGAVKAGGAAYLGQMVGGMLPKELAAVGSSAVSQLIQTGKIDISTLAVAAAQSAASSAFGDIAGKLANELQIPKELASTLVTAGLTALTSKEKQALQILQNGAVSAAINGATTGLTQEQKNFLTVGVGQVIQAATTGKFNPFAMLNQLTSLGLNQAAAAKVIGAEAPPSKISSTAVGAVSTDKSGNLYSTDDDGNRLVLTGADAGRIYTAAEWNGIQNALNAGQAQFVSAVVKNLNDGVFTPQQATAELSEAGYSQTQIQKIIETNQQYVTRASNAQSIINEYSTPGSGYDRATALEQLQKTAGYSPEGAEALLKNIDTRIQNQQKAGDILTSFAEVGSDLSTESVRKQLDDLNLYTKDEINSLIAKAEGQVAARNNYVNTTRNFVAGSASEQDLIKAMDAAGIKGEVATDQLAYYRSIKAGEELTSSEATNAAVSHLNQWQVIDRKGTQVVWDKNDEGDFYVKSARDAAGKDITNTFYGSTPQAIDRYRVQEQQQYIDRLNKQQTRTAEQFFAPGSSMTNDQAIAALKANDGMTDAMARQVVSSWNDQKAAIGKNAIAFDQTNRTSSRIMTFEEFEKVLGGVNVKTDLVTRYQAYLYTNGELIRTGNLPNGQYVLPGEVVEALNKGKPGTPLPRNAFIDDVAKLVYEGVQAGAAVGSPAQNFINSLNANFLSLFPRAGAGITSVVMGDAANDIAVALRGIAEIGSKSSDLLMPELAAEASKRMGDISSANGFVNKMVKAWDWATASPLSFGSLAWTAGKELSEDMVSFALMGKALKAIGSEPGKALGAALTDLALNYGGIAEENIGELIRQGLTPELAAQVAGSGAMPAALAETIVGGLMGAIPIDKVTKNSTIRNLIATPYRGNIDGMEEAASYLANQIGMGQKVELNDLLTSYVTAFAVGSKANIQTQLNDLLTPTAQGELVKNLDDLGYKVNVDPNSIANDAKGIVTSVVGNTAIIAGPNNQTYIIDVSNQDLTKGQTINVFGFDSTPVQLTSTQMDSLLSTIDGAFQNQLGRPATYSELSTNIQGVVGQSQGQIETLLNQTQEGKNFDLVNSIYQNTLGRKPTQSELSTALSGITSGTLDESKLTSQVKSTTEFAEVSTSVSKSQSQSVSISASASTSISKATSISESVSVSVSRSVSQSISTVASVSESISQSLSTSAVISENALKAVSISRSISESQSISLSTSQSVSQAISISNSTSQSISVSTAASISESQSISLSTSIADETATIEWITPNGQKIQLPKLWGTYTADRQIQWLNNNSYDATKLKNLGILEQDILSFVNAGLNRGSWQSESEIKAEADRISTSNSLSLSISQSISVENAATIDWTSPNGTVIKIPAKWGSWSSDQQIAWLTQNGYTAQSLKTLGISDADIAEYIKLGLNKADWLSDAERISISASTSVSTSLSQSLSTSEAQSISLSQKLFKEQEASKSASLSASVSKAIADDLLKGVSISRSVSESLSVSTSKSISVSTSQSLSTSTSVSQSLSTSASQSLSQSQLVAASSVSQSLSTSKSISTSLSQSLSISQSTSISLSISKSISVSESPSISKSLSASISVSKNVSVSESLSLSVLDKQFLEEQRSISRSLSSSLSASISASKNVSVSESLSLSVLDKQFEAEQLSASKSLSASLSTSLIKSVSASKSASLSQSISQSASVANQVFINNSISVSQSLSAYTSLSNSVSESIKASISEELARDIKENLSASVSQSASQSVSQDLSTSQSISKSISISEKLRDVDIFTKVSISQSISLSQSISESISQSLSQTVSQSVSQSVSQNVSVSQSVSQTIAPSISITPSISQSVSQSVSVSVTPSVSVSVTPSLTFTPTLVITTPTPTITATITEIPKPTIPWPPTLEPTTPQITIPPVETTTIPPTTTPVTTTKPPATTTKKPQVTTTPPPFPLFFFPGYDQTKRYIDYPQPNVPPPEFGPYDLFKAPNYLRPLQDSGNFGLAALVGAFTNDGQSGNGGNQPK